jgi:hypothetical protein
MTPTMVWATRRQPRARDVGLRTGRPVVALFGSTQALEPDVAAALTPMLCELLRTVGIRDGVVVTGGTDAGVFALLGAASLTVLGAPPMVGVAPASLIGDGLAAPEPNHTAVALTTGSAWGDELPSLSALVSELAGRRTAVAVLAGGGEVSRRELAEHVRRGRPVIVLAGSGRLADDVVSGATGNADRGLSALLAGGNVLRVDVGDGPEALRAVLDETLGPARPLRTPRMAALTALPHVRAARPAPARVVALETVARYPTLMSAFETAERVVGPALRECDSTALREQNRHRWYVTLGLVGGLATTILGAVQSWLTSSAWPGVALATVGAATSGLVTVSRRQGSLDAYVSARTRAERLRGLYFEYLTAGPDAWDGRGEALLHEEAVRRRYGLPAAPPSNAQAQAEATRSNALITDGTTRAASEPVWVAQAVMAYRRHRVESQADWYEGRAAGLEAAVRQTITSSAVLLVLAALFGALSAAEPLHRSLWAVVATAFGALATATNNYEAMSGFGRLARRYQDTAAALRLAAAQAVHVDAAGLPTFVQDAEGVLLGEVGTWSVLLRQAHDEAASGAPPQ